MSSRLLLPDDSQQFAPLRWRQVQAAATPVLLRPDTAAAVSPAEDDTRKQQEWEQRLTEARAAGMREGEAAGRSAAHAALQPALKRLVDSIEELATLRSRLRREAEADTVQLAIAVARRVIRRELAVDPEAPEWGGVGVA